MTDGLLSLCCRRERALSKISSKSNRRTVPAPAVFNRPQSPTSTWSPTASPTSPLPSHVYYTPAMDEPLALIKKPRKEPEREEEKAKIAAPAQIQVRGCTDNFWKDCLMFYLPSSLEVKEPYVSHCGLGVAPGQEQQKVCFPSVASKSNCTRHSSSKSSCRPEHARAMQSSQIQEENASNGKKNASNKTKQTALPLTRI